MLRVDSLGSGAYSVQKGSVLGVRSLQEEDVEPQAMQQQIRGLALIAAVVLLVVSVRYFLRWI